jgi:hypothetical protein
LAPGTEVVGGGATCLRVKLYKVFHGVSLHPLVSQVSQVLPSQGVDKFPVPIAGTDSGYGSAEAKRLASGRQKPEKPGTQRTI